MSASTSSKSKPISSKSIATAKNGNVEGSGGGGGGASSSSSSNSSNNNNQKKISVQRLDPNKISNPFATNKSKFKT